MAVIGGPVKLPPDLDLQSSNAAKEWKFWKSTFEDYLVATGQDEAQDKVKLSILCYLIGQTNEDKALRDKILMGIRDPSTREALLRIDLLTLEKVITFCRTSEQSKQQSQQFQSDSHEINFIKKNKKGKNMISNNGDQKFVSSNNKMNKNKFQCRRCGTLHGLRQCPTYGQICRKCGIKNHFAISCKVKNVKTIECNSNSSSTSDLFVNTIRVNNVHHKQNHAWDEIVIIKIDTRADVSIMPLKVDSQFKIRPTNYVLKAFEGSTLKPTGVVRLHCNYKDNLPFVSHECKTYYREKDISIFTCSPHHHRSNGMAGKAVSVAKQILRKSMEDRTDYRESIMERLRILLPVISTKLEPKVQTHIYDFLRRQQITYKNNYDKSSKKSFTNFKKGDKVVIKTDNEKTWQKATKIKKANESRSYWIQRHADLKMLRRNTKHIKPSYTKLNNNKKLNPELYPECSYFKHTNELNQLVVQNDASVDAEDNNRGNVVTKPPIENQQINIKSRSGRIVRPPNRLNL
ncbi:hypothetical protein ILUMI_00703 [Ignelater luminosus]|uniref:Integrase catalytic domain-containing protein n=1 Tax=Ignelater luminosus TaxID=2038154 RepID=A0A8K0DS52_IGNLU|nr:hypothetical protein ILUMI_00703 [Ignelater luminosus]